MREPSIRKALLCILLQHAPTFAADSGSIVLAFGDLEAMALDSFVEGFSAIGSDERDFHAGISGGARTHQIQTPTDKVLSKRKKERKT